MKEENTLQVNPVEPILICQGCDREIEALDLTQDADCPDCGCKEFWDKFKDYPEELLANELDRMSPEDQLRMEFMFNGMF